AHGGGTDECNGHPGYILTNERRGEATQEQPLDQDGCRRDTPTPRSKSGLAASDKTTRHEERPAFDVNGTSERAEEACGRDAEGRERSRRRVRDADDGKGADTQLGHRRRSRLPAGHERHERGRRE